MSYVMQKDEQTSLLHVIRDLDGSVHTGSVTGLSATLLDESQVDNSSLATWTEPVVGGYLSIDVTPDSVGNWLLSVTDPSGTAQNTTHYTIQVVANTAGLTPTGTYLTTLANLKERLEITNTASDDYLTNLIARASTRVETRFNRNVLQATYTEYYDGDGTEWLNLRQGPIQSVTSVASVDWTSGSASTTSVNASDYLIYGKAADGWNLPGVIRANGWSWTRGRQLWEVVYVGGFSTVPYDFEQLCLDLCIWHKNRRKDVATSSRDIGSGSTPFSNWSELDEVINSVLEPYMDVRVPT